MQKLEEEMVVNRRRRSVVEEDCGNIKIPMDVLQEILSRLGGLKANIHVSLVCKTWLEAAVSIRKLQSRPWLFYQKRGSEDGDYLLFDLLRSLTYQLKFPELKNHAFTCSRDGWLLVSKNASSLFFFLNPFTGERIYLPKKPGNILSYGLTFSAAPTSSNCCVVSLVFETSDNFFVVETWRPGDSEWATLKFLNQSYGYGTERCLFSNGMFYCLSLSGILGVFDPFATTWEVLPVDPCPVLSRRCPISMKPDLPVFMTEHEGDIFVVTTRCKNDSKLLVFKLNLELDLWEEMRGGLGGLTLFSCYAATFTRSGLLTEERNRVYASHIGDNGGVGCTHPPYNTYLPSRSAWLQPPPPPHNNLSL